MLKDIITSKARRGILELFYLNLGESYHLRRVGRILDLEINAVKRELDILESAKVLLKEKRLNKSVYSVNTSYLYFDEFLRIFAKRTKLAQAIRKSKTKLGKIKYVACSLKLIKKQEIKGGGVYILFVGVVVAPEVEKLMKSLENEYPFEINYTVMTTDELEYRKQKNDPFIWGFLREPKVMLVGSEEGLML